MGNSAGRAEIRRENDHIPAGRAFHRSKTLKGKTALRADLQSILHFGITFRTYFQCQTFSFREYSELAGDLPSEVLLRLPE